MQAHGSHDRALTAFRDGKVQILLGTQMIAKGLDFPNVTLVGVINADTALHLPDFRAAERTFQLVTQVAGRTGRGDKGGRVLVQTFSPEHPAIQAAVQHDFGAFVREELPVRQAHQYPPVAAMVRLVVRGKQEAHTKMFAENLGDRLRGDRKTAFERDAGDSRAGPRAGAVSEIARSISISLAVARAGWGSAAGCDSPRRGGIGRDRGNCVDRRRRSAGDDVRRGPKTRDDGRETSGIGLVWGRGAS